MPGRGTSSPYWHCPNVDSMFLGMCYGVDDGLAGSSQHTDKQGHVSFSDDVWRRKADCAVTGVRLSRADSVRSRICDTSYVCIYSLITLRPRYAKQAVAVLL